jgi:hypothetical protein
MYTFDLDRQVEYPKDTLEHSDEDQQDDEWPEENDENNEEDTDQEDDEWTEEEYLNETWPRKHLLEAFNDFCEPGGHTIENIIQIDELIQFNVNSENINEYDMESGYYLTSENMIKGNTRTRKIQNRVRFFKKIQEIVSVEPGHYWVTKSVQANHGQNETYYVYNWIDDAYNKRYKIFSTQPVTYGEDTDWFITCERENGECHDSERRSAKYGLTEDQEHKLERVFNAYCEVHEIDVKTRVDEISRAVGYDVNANEWWQNNLHPYSTAERLGSNYSPLVFDNEINRNSRGPRQKAFFAAIQKVISPEIPLSQSQVYKPAKGDWHQHTRPLTNSLCFVYSWKSEATRKIFMIYPERVWLPQDSSRTQWFLSAEDC